MDEEQTSSRPFRDSYSTPRGALSFEEEYKENNNCDPKYIIEGLEKKGIDKKSIELRFLGLDYSPFE